MARKKLLTEGEIRQFMKLANLRPISRDRLSEYGMGMPGQRDEEEEEFDPEAAGAEEGDEEMDLGDDEEMDLGGEEDMEMDLGAEEEGGGEMVSMDNFMSALE